MYSLGMSDPFEPDPDVEAAIRSAVERLGTGSQRCGLHLSSARVALPEDAPGPALVIADFAVGDLAFTDRVLNPSGEEDNKAVRKMQVDLDLDEWLEARRRLENLGGPDDDE
jgi:hypothetical protein